MGTSFKNCAAHYEFSIEKTQDEYILTYFMTPWLTPSSNTVAVILNFARADLRGDYWKKNI